MLQLTKFTLLRDDNVWCTIEWLLIFVWSLAIIEDQWFPSSCFYITNVHSLSNINSLCIFQSIKLQKVQCCMAFSHQYSLEPHRHISNAPFLHYQGEIQFLVKADLFHIWYCLSATTQSDLFLSVCSLSKICLYEQPLLAVIKKQQKWSTDATFQHDFFFFCKRDIA